MSARGWDRFSWDCARQGSAFLVRKVMTGDYRRGGNVSVFGHRCSIFVLSRLKLNGRVAAIDALMVVFFSKLVNGTKEVYFSP